MGEWIMNRAQIPVREYEQLARQFKPTKFDAEAWVKLAHDAGMKYVVVTAKHHDGFALIRSRVSTFNVVDATPFKRDVLKELAAACAKYGIRLGLYYSQSQDWHEPHAAGNTWDFGPDEAKDFDAYLRAKAEPQVRELVTEYGPIALVWFDTPRLMTAERAKRFSDLVRSYQPMALIDGRLGVAGDYVTTGDNVIPSEVPSQPWETPATLNHTWGYRKDDHDWKSPGQVVFTLLDIVSKGGNYLLNVGPTGEGEMPQPARDVLRSVGKWLSINGEAVYGALPTPFGDELGEFSTRNTVDLRGNQLFLARTEYRVTAKPGKLYFTFFVEPRVPFQLPSMKNTAKRAYRLADGAPLPLRIADGGTYLDIGRPLNSPTAATVASARHAITDPMGTVVVVEIEGNQVTR